MLFADFGTSYCKILDTGTQDTSALSCPLPRNLPRILRTSALPPDFRADLATGHNAARRGRQAVNELIALARGGRRLIADHDCTLLDCGSRDLKFVRFQNGEVADMGWNTECGASMGFTIELLGNYYGLDYAALPAPKRGFSVTCGVLGMSHIFDAVVRGASEAEAVAGFVRGIAMNAWRFAGAPKALYLSGGLCDNPLFLNCLPCVVHPLGRFVLLEGLIAVAEEASALAKPGKTTDI